MSRTKIITLSMLIVLSALLVGSVCVADESPSFKDTVEFIEKKCSWHGNGFIDEVKLISNKDNRCKMTVVKESFYYRNGKKGRKVGYSKQRFSLSDFDPTRISHTTDMSMVYPHCREDKKCVHINYSHQEGKARDIYDADLFVLNTSNPDVNGPKLIKALKHLINLCGGKGELF